MIEIKRRFGGWVSGRRPISDPACTRWPGQAHHLERYVAAFFWFSLIFLAAVPVLGQESTAAPGPSAAADPAAPNAPASLTDIHDILPPLAVGSHAPWLLPVLLALMAAALLAAVVWFRKKNRQDRHIETIAVELPPETVAMRAFEEIADVHRLDPKAFYFRLSAILRQYISGRFTVRAAEMTTEEFLPCIDGLAVNKTLAQKLKRLSRAMDPVKFGAETTAENQMAEDLRFAREFVAKTTPSPTDEGSDGAVVRNTVDGIVNRRQPLNTGHHLSDRKG